MAAAASSAAAAEEDLRALARMAAFVFERHGAAALTAAARGLCSDAGFRTACGQLAALGAAVAGMDDAGGSGGVEAAQVRT
jgi:hypothetical protein